MRTRALATRLLTATRTFPDACYVACDEGVSRAYHFRGRNHELCLPSPCYSGYNNLFRSYTRGVVIAGSAVTSRGGTTRLAQLGFLQRLSAKTSQQLTQLQT